MGTRGILGLRVDGTDKLTYNHFDSYPEGLGVRTIMEISGMLRTHGADWIANHARRMSPIVESHKPTAEQIKDLEKFTDLSVSNQSTDDWYCLTRKAQGNLTSILEARWFKDSADFTKDSLFCEWGWIANLDENVLEIYRGFQKKIGEGRYADKGIGSKEYKGIALVEVITFYEIAKVETAEDALALLSNLVQKEDAA